MPDIVSVDETVPVITRFEEGTFRPVRFLWRERVHRIQRVTGRWGDHDGQYRIYHFSVVSVAGDYYELSFHTRHMAWRIDRMMTE